jgi:hypothetical protein
MIKIHKKKDKRTKRKRKHKKRKNETNVVKTLTRPTSYNILCYSSLFFITNIFTAFYKGYILYSSFFVFLTITSLIVHTNDNIYTNTIDKLGIVFIVIYGSYIVYNKTERNNIIQVFVVVLCLLFCIWVYIYGYIRKDYCFSTDKYIADRSHCLMHLLSSFGHHLIIFL